MTSTKNQNTETTTGESISGKSVLKETDTSTEKIKTTLSELVKEVLATKNNQKQFQENSRKTDKGKKIGMPPKGTRRSMGKR